MSGVDWNKDGEEVLLLVDGFNLLWRAAFGFPAVVRSPGGTDVTAVFAFFALLRSSCRALDAPVECVVCFDGAEGLQSRKVSDSEYKQNRVDVDVSPLEWLDDIKKGLDMIGVGWVESCAHEADDVIATLVRRSVGRPRSILSMDKDFYQLIDEWVTVLNTVKKRSRALVNRAEVVERFGVEPWQWCDFRALMGDPSDNISGVRGIGQVRAARILADGLTLEEARAAGRLVGAAGAAADQVWEKVLTWREMIRLRTDIDLPTLPPGTSVDAAHLPLAAAVVNELGLWR
ncbi:MAG: 5'-3' exonuclease [Pseudonocardiaceae bacterium]